MVKKLAQVGVLVLVFLVLPALGRPEVLGFAKLWILAALAIVATVYQPSYSPTDTGPTQDRGTCLQIIWSVYVSQLAAILEAIYLRYPESFAWTPLAIVALVIALLGLVLRSWAVVVLGEFFTMYVETKPEHSVVQHGPYRYVRHPSYTGAILTYLGLPLFLGAYCSFVLSAVGLALAYYRRIPIEEQELVKNLGEPYLEYMQRVGMLFPKLRR